MESGKRVNVAVLTPPYMPTLQDFLSHPIESLEKALHLRKQIAQLEKMLQEVMSPEPM